MKRGAILPLLFLLAAGCGEREETAAAGVTAGDVGQPAGQAQPAESESENATGVKEIQVTGGGPVIQILPGPFPFPDSAAPVIAQRPEDQRKTLEAQVQQGPYSNNVAPISGNFSFTAWDRGAAQDSVAGAAEFQTQERIGAWS